MKKIFNLNSLVAILILPLLLAFYLPIEIYSKNATDSGIALSSLLFYLVILVACAVVFLALPLLFFKPRQVAIYTKLLTYITLYSWLVATFLYGFYGVLDGKPLQFNSLSSDAILQIVLLIVLVGVFFIQRLDKYSKNIALLLVVVMFVTTFFNLVTMDKKVVQSKKSGFHQGLTEFSKNNPNVIHVILDELQSDIFLHIVNNDPVLKETFSGFTVYKDALSVYPTTVMSIPSMLTGQIYRNQESKEDFVKAIKDVPTSITRLKEKDFRLDMYGMCSDIIENCTALHQPMSDAIETNFTQLVQLIDLSIFRAMPDLFKPWIYARGKWLLANRVIAKSYLKIPLVGPAKLAFDRFLSEINAKDSTTAKYKLYHSLITHDPVALEGNCQIANAAQLKKLTRIEFSRCGIGLFAQLINKLKALGIYDNTMIILSSDHGAGEVQFLDQQAFSQLGINAKEIAYSFATLMVKPYDATGTLQISNIPASLIDISKTILSANGVAQNEKIKDSYYPLNLLANNFPTDRVREYYFYQWPKDGWTLKTLPQLTKFLNIGDKTLATTWEMQTTQQVKELACGEVIHFNQADLANLNMVGLSDAEPWGRWSDANRVSIQFKTVPSCQEKTISFDLIGFVNPNRKTQQASVVLNGIGIGKVNFAYNKQEQQTVRFTFAKRALNSDGLNTIEFKIDNPISPKLLGISDDPRQLAIGFKSMQIN